MKKVISFSLYGDNPIYTIGAIKNVELSRIHFPEWEVWIYHNNTVPQHILNELKSHGVKLINMEHDIGFGGSLWRFLPCSENIERFISRDCDSRLSERDRVAVDEWIKSEKNFHIIREHPIGHRSLINAGMWGCKGNVVNNMDEIITDFLSSRKCHNIKSCDQSFLNSVIYPLTKVSSLVHDEFFNHDSHRTHIKRKRDIDDYAFIGESIDENDKPRGDQRTSIRNFFN